MIEGTEWWGFKHERRIYWEDSPASSATRGASLWTPSTQAIGPGRT